MKMDTMEELRRLYTAYLESMKEYEEQDRALRGTLSALFTGARSGDACSARFAEDVRAALSALAEAQPSPEEAAAATDFVLAQSEARAGEMNPTALMLEAMHGCLKPLVPFLTPSAAADFARRYDRSFPKRRRTPVMRDLSVLLTKRAGN